MQSFGSQTWDASLIIEALLATNLIEDIGPTLAKGHEFIKNSQVCLILLFLFDIEIVNIHLKTENGTIIFLFRNN